jgi:DNA-binding transcriptional ArsR family regulator
MQSMAPPKDTRQPKRRLDVDRAVTVMRALSNPHRLKILSYLRDSELSVGELEHAVGIRQPSMSQQLARLREDGLVATRREGKQIFYSLSDTRAKHLIRALGAIFKR